MKKGRRERAPGAAQTGGAEQVGASWLPPLPSSWPDIPKFFLRFKGRKRFRGCSILWQAVFQSSTPNSPTFSPQENLPVPACNALWLRCCLYLRKHLCVSPDSRGCLPFQALTSHFARVNNVFTLPFLSLMNRRARRRVFIAVIICCGAFGLSCYV